MPLILFGGNEAHRYYAKNKIIQSRYRFSINILFLFSYRICMIEPNKDLKIHNPFQTDL